MGGMVLDSQWRTTMDAKLALCIVGEVDGLSEKTDVCGD